MAITTYTELKSTIADFLNRDDLTAIIPTFISLAESQINRDVRHWKMENLSQASTSNKFLVKPADWVENIKVGITNTGYNELDLVNQQEIGRLRRMYSDALGEPECYIMSENSYELFPTPDGEYDIELLYYQKVSSLSDENATNWLLSDAPDVYLYGALIHSSPYLKDDARVTMFSQMYAAAVSQLNGSSSRAKYSGSGLRLKIRGY